MIDLSQACQINVIVRRLPINGTSAKTVNAPSKKNKKVSTTMHVMRHLILGLAILHATQALFVIKAVDAETGKGVPLVSFKTTSAIEYWTDSNGIIAFNEPGLLDSNVYFYIWSHGYYYPADLFGYNGTTLSTVNNTAATVTMLRINVAERMYRTTGQGVYSESVLAGLPFPNTTRHPALNAQVTGQDGIITVRYNDSVHWFWGDTNKVSYPLGNFGTTGAVTAVNLDLNQGPPDFQYYQNSDGFVKSMIPLPSPSVNGVRWLDAAVTINQNGTDILLAQFHFIASDQRSDSWGLLVWNVSTSQFDIDTMFEANSAITPVVSPGSFRQATLRDEDGVRWMYLGRPYPMNRCVADLQLLRDPRNWESFTCLTAGTRVEGSDAQHITGASIERLNGKAVWGWKKNTAAVNDLLQESLHSSGYLTSNELHWNLRDPWTGEQVWTQSGTINWNQFKRKYVLIIEQLWGSQSALGEIWYAESDSFHGPFNYAVKIVTHHKYSFYNPYHHEMFDNGDQIFFEATFANTFSGVESQVPRYEYNNIMYRLNLTRAELAKLPRPIYLKVDGADTSINANELTTTYMASHTIPFYAFTVSLEELIPVFFCNSTARLSTTKLTNDCVVLFYALNSAAKDPPSTAIAMTEYHNGETYSYALGPSSANTICYVWASPNYNSDLATQSSGLGFIVPVVVLAAAVALLILILILAVKHMKQ